MENQIIPVDVLSPVKPPIFHLLRRRSFPSDFIFGAASSAYQYEGGANIGGRSQSIWDTFTTKHPDKILDKSNGTVANDSYHRYQEDVALLKKLGMNVYRFSISWPRILPTGKPSGGVNREGVDYYNNLIDELLANDIEPWVTLFHWDLPQPLQDEYGSDGYNAGFLNRKIVDDFGKYAKVCFWEFGDRVKHWITINEPWSFSSLGYGSGVLAPGRGAPPPTGIISRSSTGSSGGGGEPKKTLTTMSRYYQASVAAAARGGGGGRGAMVKKAYSPELIGDPATEPYIVAHNLLLAHAAAVHLYRQQFQAGQKGKIGITLNTNWFEPLCESSASDQSAAQRAQDFTFGWFMDPLTSGQYPSSMQTNVGSRLPEFTAEESKLLIDSFDFLGLNFYTAYYATDSPKTPNQAESYDTDSHVKLESERNGIPIGKKGTSAWIYDCPEGFYKTLTYIKHKYNNPLVYITENGVDEARNLILSETCEDKTRETYIKGHLLAVLRAIDNEKANVKGYMVWSLLDNFEWASGYSSCFGLFNVDYRNGLQRYPKNSALWFMNFLKEDIPDIPRKRQLPFDDSNTRPRKI